MKRFLSVYRWNWYLICREIFGFTDLYQEKEKWQINEPSFQLKMKTVNTKWKEVIKDKNIN